MSEIINKKEGVGFDLIPIPSKGKIYDSVKSKIRVSYMDASDENILTSPNIVTSPDFLKILIDRNLIEPNLCYDKLHAADLYAIMIWLRATAFGTEYPITVFTKKGEPFDYDYDLSTIKFREFKLEPNKNGLFEYKSKEGILYEFKFMSISDGDEIDEIVEKEKKEWGDEPNFIDRTPQLSLIKMIKSVNGDSDVDFVNKHISTMKLSSIREFRRFISDNEPFIDTKIDIVTDSGEAVSTFLPVNVQFFWPDVRL